jgi:hypothetical protein
VYETQKGIEQIDFSLLYRQMQEAVYILIEKYTSISIQKYTNLID